MKATQHVNPGQVPVLTVDQPLYAIAKAIQWSWPDQYGEGKYGLHIEMALLNVLGNWLDGSGWVAIMATVMSPQKDEPMLFKVAHTYPEHSGLTK